MQEINVRLNGHPVIEAEFTAQQGVVPGTGFALFADENALGIVDSACLRFDDGRKVVEINNLLVTKSTIVEHSNDKRMQRLELSDKRELWRDIRVTGAFNLTEPDNSTYKIDTLNNGVQYTLKDLLVLVLNKTGETIPCNIASLVGITPKNIRWDNTLLSDVLRDLLALGDVNIEIQNDGGFQVVPRLTGGSVEYNADIIALETEESKDNVEIPSKIKIVGGRTWREAEIGGSWMPVCLSDGTNGKVNGGVYPLSEIVSDWQLSLGDIRQKCLQRGGFEDIPGTDDEKRKRRQILQQCAYKWHRCPVISAHLPWLGHCAEVDADGKPLPIVVKHTFFRLKNQASSGFRDPYENISTPTKSSYAFEVDHENGIIKFRDVQGTLIPTTGDVHDTRLDGRSLAAGSQIEATVAWKVPANEENARFEYEKDNKDASGGVFTLRRDDFRLRQRDIGTSIEELNRSNLEDSASKMIVEIAQRYGNTQIKRVKYAGCYETEVSGAVKSVKYKASAEYGLTTEVEIKNIPALPGDVILDDTDFADSGVDSSGEERKLQQVNAYSVGPVVIKADDNVLPESLSFVKASGSPDDVQLKELGVMRNPFFWERENDIGGWFTLSLATVITGTQPYYMVKESDENCEIAKGSKGIDVTNLEESALKDEDLVIVLEAHNGHKVAFPLNRKLICDHTHKDEDDENVSTEVTNADADDEKIGDFDDIFWIKRDAQDIARLMLNIDTESPQAFYTGSGDKNGAVAQLGGEQGVLIAPKDCQRHVLGKNKDKEPVIEGHLTTELNFYQDRVGDGPIDFVQAIRDMAEDPLGKYLKADMWWDYTQNKWIPWYQMLWQKIPPPVTPPTYPPFTPPPGPPVQVPVDNGVIIAPCPNIACVNPVVGLEDANMLGCNDLPWRGLHLGEYAEDCEVLPGIFVQGGDGFCAFVVPKGKKAAIVRFDEGVEVEFREAVKLEKTLEVEGEITGGNASDSWLRRDGQNSPTANVNWGGFQISNVCHIQQKDDCRHYFGDDNDVSMKFDTSADCLKIEGKDICVEKKVRTGEKFRVGEQDGLGGTMVVDDGANYRVSLTFAGGILVGQNIEDTSGTAEATFEKRRRNAD
ncbi:MAG: hypothetical protein K8S87_01690 [Planctomycetes bacterium]|nr:hypothetical protein [Planctomycetota bacterium]